MNSLKIQKNYFCNLNFTEAIAIDCEEILGTIESQNKPVQKDEEMEVDVALGMFKMNFTIFSHI